MRILRRGIAHGAKTSVPIFQSQHRSASLPPGKTSDYLRSSYLVTSPSCYSSCGHDIDLILGTRNCTLAIFHIPRSCLILQGQSLILPAQTLPLFVMKTFNWSSSGAGLIFVVGALPSAGGVYIGKAINRTGARIPYIFCFLLAAVCWICLRFVERKRIFEIVLLVILLFLQGFCIAAIEITATTEVSQAASKFEARYPGAFGDTSPVGQSYGLFNMAFAGGQLIGPVLAGGIRVSAGWKMMTLVLGLLCVVAAVVLGSFSAPGVTEGEEEEEEEEERDEEEV